MTFYGNLEVQIVELVNLDVKAIYITYENNKSKVTLFTLHQK